MRLGWATPQILPDGDREAPGLDLQAHRESIDAEAKPFATIFPLISPMPKDKAKQS